MSASANPAALLERSDALDALRGALERSRAGPDGRLLMLGGEAGVGKTALLRAFCADQRPPASVLWGGCEPLFTPRPLGPVLDIAGHRRCARRDGGGRPATARVAAAMLQELEAATPAIVVLEDVHWADEATLDVLRLLGRRVGRAGAARR